MGFRIYKNSKLYKDCKNKLELYISWDRIHKELVSNNNFDSSVGFAIWSRTNDAYNVYKKTKNGETKYNKYNSNEFDRLSKKGSTPKRSRTVKSPAKRGTLSIKTVRNAVRKVTKERSNGVYTVERGEHHEGGTIVAVLGTKEEAEILKNKMESLSDFSDVDYVKVTFWKVGDIEKNLMYELGMLDI